MPGRGRGGSLTTERLCLQLHPHSLTPSLSICLLAALSSEVEYIVREDDSSEGRGTA